MKEIVVGAIIGGLMGVVITIVERQVGYRGHAIIGSIAGASIGGLIVALGRQGAKLS